MNTTYDPNFKIPCSSTTCPEQFNGIHCHVDNIMNPSIIKQIDMKKTAALIGKAFYIDKNFDPTNTNLESLRGALVLAFPPDTKDIVTLWCRGQELTIRAGTENNL